MTDESQTPPTKIRVIRPATIPVIYVEGISQMAVGFPNSRLMLNQFSQQSGEDENREEVHHLACELVVPTAALVEMAQGILKHLGSSKELLQSGGTEWMQKVIDVIATLPATTPPQEQ